jgi:hypothetical protein
MNKICLEKLMEFTHTVYQNYYGQFSNLAEINNEITKLKQNTSLNEKGTFIKYNYVNLSSVFDEVQYDESILICPISFNIGKELEWYNFLNCLLLIFNDDYIKSSNAIKKKFLEKINEEFKHYLKNKKEVEIMESSHYVKIAELTNLNFIILEKKNNVMIIDKFENPSSEKWIVCWKFNGDFLPLWNFETKYYLTNSIFIQYLLKYSLESDELNEVDDSNQSIQSNELNVFSTVKEKKNKNDKQKKDKNNKKAKYEDDSIKKSKKVKVDDLKNQVEKEKTNGNTKTLDKNSGGYEELLTNESYALYISEAVENSKVNITKSNKTAGLKKTKETNIELSNGAEQSDTSKSKNKGSKTKSNKTNKNIFLPQEVNKENKTDVTKTKANKEKVEKSNNDNENQLVSNKEDGNNFKEFQIKNPETEMDNIPSDKDESIFKKTVMLTKTRLDQIISSIKCTTKLEKIQEYALELGLEIVHGSNKFGKPKNKTKTELIGEIKNIKI